MKQLFTSWTNRGLCQDTSKGLRKVPTGEWVRLENLSAVSFKYKVSLHACLHSLSSCPLKPSGVRKSIESSYQVRQMVNEQTWWQRVNESLDRWARLPWSQYNFIIDWMLMPKKEMAEWHTDRSRLGHWLGVGSTERRAGSVGKTECSIWPCWI